MPEKLKAILAQTEQGHNVFCQRARVAQHYYKNQTAVLKSGAAAIAEVNGYLRKLGKSPLRSADNRIATNWHRIITDQKVGYAFSFAPVIDVCENSKASAVLQNSFKGDWSKLLKNLAIDATNAGVAWLAYWKNQQGEFSFWQVSPMQVIPYYDRSSIKPKLEQLVYITHGEGDVVYYQLWNSVQVEYFVKNKKGEILKDTAMGQNGVIKHSYGEIPFIAFNNNSSQIGDLEMYKPIVDAIDKLISGFANDIDDMQEIIWVIKNYAGEETHIDFDRDGNPIERQIDLLQKLKAKKVINVEGDGGVDTLRSEIPFEARGKFLDILMRQLYISAMAVDPFPQSIGQASGVYIDFLYSLLELKVGLLETEFRSSIEQLARAILKNANLNAETIEQVWLRNKPKNHLETVQMIAQTESDVLSNQSKTKAHPLVECWQAEIEQIKREGEENELSKNL